jgi:DNA mismatch endonuclease (patch repair protein)
MVDHLTKEMRSWNMSRIRSKDTEPELIVRSLLHKMGYRFRLHRKGLPGKPDIVLAKYKTVIFVHGCWWHRHNCHLGRRTPKSRTKYWLPKLAANKKRDKENRKELRRLGWEILVIWECQTKKLQRIIAKIISSLK